MDKENNGQKIRGYKDKYGKAWLCISKENGKKTIYSDLCLLTKELSLQEINLKQPSLKDVKALEGESRPF